MSNKKLCIYVTIAFVIFFIIYKYISIFFTPQVSINGKNNGSILYMINEREMWVSAVERIVTPVLTNMAEGNLQSYLAKIRKERSSTASFEAIARTLDGIAPWLELPPDETSESKIREKFLKLAHRALEQGVNFTSQDSIINLGGTQPLVEYAYLSQAFLRSPKRLWGGLDKEVQKKWIDQLKKSREIKPYQNNWLLFSGEVEAFLWNVTNECDEKRMNIGPNTFMDSWFVGEGTYKDGSVFHFDYYNSYVIHPMLLDILIVKARKEKSDKATLMLKEEKKRGILYARWLERLIAPDGSYPVFGRSICCRMGVFHHLADVALRHGNIANVPPAQIRSALSAVIKKQVGNQNFDQNGFLKLGFNGDQPDICEGYFNQGSLYHSVLIFLPLGLHKEDPFWTEPAKSWTSKLAWEGQVFRNDH